MKRITTSVSQILFACSVVTAVCVRAGTQCTAEVEGIRIDLTPGVRTAQEMELLTYSPQWAGCEGTPTVTVCIEGGDTLLSDEASAGTYSWTTPTELGTYVLKHETRLGGELMDTLTANFEVRIKLVTVTLPVVPGATAQVYAFDANGGWAAVETNEVPTNASVRVVWTAQEGKALTGVGARNVYCWQSPEFVADKAVQYASAPTVGALGESSVTIDIDTRAEKTYFRTADVLPVWAAAGADVEVEKVGGGEQRSSLVKDMAATNTFSWHPTAMGTYTLSHTDLAEATIMLVDPVEVTTNGLAVAGATLAVTVDGAPLLAQTEDAFAGKLIVPSNATVTVTWTCAGVYFADGSTTYVQTFKADKAVNAASEAVTKPDEPKLPSVKVGLVAERYPWDGKLDVWYWAKNTPATGYVIDVTVTLPGGGSAKQTVPALNGKNAIVFDAKAAFGEVFFTNGVKVKAALAEAEPR